MTRLAAFGYMAAGYVAFFAWHRRRCDKCSPR